MSENVKKQDNTGHAEKGCSLDGVVRHWRVTVAVEGQYVVTIESNCLSGVHNVADYRTEIIDAAENLLAFIGTGCETCEFDEPNAKISDESPRN